MKKNFLLLFALSILFITYSCSSENTDADNAASATADESTITQTRAKSSTEESQEEDFFFSISRKWELGEDYIDLKADGSFDAIMEGEEIHGKWGMTSSTEDKRMLKLVGFSGENEDEFNKTYELINVSFERLEGIDAEGNRIRFFAAE